MALGLIDAWTERDVVGAAAAAVVTAAGVTERRVAGAARPETLFALASLTKPLVAVAVLVAADEGALELDAPVGRWLEPYRSPARAAVTARHLLAHAAGLPESGPRGLPSLEVEPERPPATRRVYSNEGYGVLGELLTRATGIPYAEYVREAVMEPLGMDAFMGLPDGEAARAADVRQPGLYRPGVAMFNSQAWRRRASAAGGGFASVEGYARFAAWALGDGSPLLAAETFADMRENQFGALPGGVESFLTWERGDWGLGWDIRDAKQPHWTGSRTSPRTLSHFGASGTLVWVDPDAALGLVCLANRGTYSGWMMRDGGWPALSDATLAEHGA